MQHILGFFKNLLFLSKIFKLSTYAQGQAQQDKQMGCTDASNPPTTTKAAATLEENAENTTGSRQVNSIPLPHCLHDAKGNANQPNAPLSAFPL